MAKVDVLSSSLVGMATNNNVISRLELTPWDLQELRIHAIQRGLLFHYPKSQDFRENFIHHLKKSLARSLDFFPPLAGRLETIKNSDNTMLFFINCNNAGVEFTHAIAPNISTSDILEPTYIPEVMISSFFPFIGSMDWEGISKPLLGVQVTELVDGYIIGCTASHAVVDGTSFWHFINSWSEISRGSDAISKTPCFERWFPNSVSPDNRPIPHPLPIKPIFNNNISSTPLLTRVFHFNKESVAQLKTNANSEAGTDNNISSLQALVAHLWRSVTRSRKSTRTQNPNENKEIGCFLAVNVRPRIPLPDGYFGNAANVAIFTTCEDKLLQRGLGWAALKLHELVAKQTREGTVKLAEESLKSLGISYDRPPTGSYLFVTSSPRDNVYGNDFGWGKPMAVRSSSEHRTLDGVTVLSPGAPQSGGGISIEVSLEAQVLMAMGVDAEFMKFATI